MKAEGIKKLKIGNVLLPSPVILAPMAGVTDLPFRYLCSGMGAGMVCMEMVSAKAISYHNRNTYDMLRIHEEEAVVSLQLFGHEPEVMAESAKAIEEYPFQVLDINMGCPVPKVVGNGEGSALMRNPLLAGEIISAVCKAVKKPVTVKIRSGFDADHINAAELAHIAEESGAAAVAVHARTREQYYSGKADWSVIREVKERVGIPVIGNGDVTDGESFLSMIEETDCDGVMIGRAARGNPWIFREINFYIKEGRSMERPSVSEVADMILKHGKMLVEYKGEYVGLREMRQHAAWYTSGYPHSASFRRRMNEVTTMEGLEELVLEFRAGFLDT